MDDLKEQSQIKWKIGGQTRNSRPIYESPEHPPELELGSGYTAADHLDAYYWHMKVGNKETNIPKSQTHMNHANAHKESAERYQSEFVKSLKKLRDRLVKYNGDDENSDEPSQSAGFQEFDPESFDPYAMDEEAYFDPESAPAKQPVTEEQADRPATEEAAPEKPEAVSPKTSQKWEPRKDYSPEEQAQIEKHVKDGYSPREAERLAEAHKGPKNFLEGLRHHVSASEPSPKMLSELKEPATRYLDRAKRLRAREADPAENPVIFARERVRQAAEQHGAKFKKEKEDYLKDIGHLKGGDRRKAVVKWEQDWHKNNPEHRSNLKDVAQAHKHFDTAADARAENLHDLARYIAFGGGDPTATKSAEEAAQHVGGVKTEEGTQVSTIKDPLETFRQKYPEFVKIMQKRQQAGHESADRYNRVTSARAQHGLMNPQQPPKPEAKKQTDIKGSLSDLPAAVTDPGTREKLEHFFTEHAPTYRGVFHHLKGLNVIPEDKADIHKHIPEAWEGLMHAVKTYDPKAGAKFSTWASRNMGHYIRESMSRDRPAGTSVPKHWQQEAKRLEAEAQKAKAPQATPSTAITTATTPPPMPVTGQKPEGDK